MFKGSNVALVTPFKNDKLDDETYIKLIHFHIENGTNGLVPAGTTGESPTLSHDEHQRVIDLCIKESKGRIPVSELVNKSNTSWVFCSRPRLNSVSSSVNVLSVKVLIPIELNLFRRFSSPFCEGKVSPLSIA